MNTEMLLLAVLAAMTVVAFMIAINSRGRWRATLSSLLAVGMLVGTVWVFTLHYSMSFNADNQRERHHIMQELITKDQTALTANSSITVCSTLIVQTNDFAGTLLKERLYDPSLSHDQMIARANSAERRLEELQSQINSKKQMLESHPEVATLLSRAMTELKTACHLYNRYYFAENTAAEIQTERLLRQKAQSARDTLIKAEKTLEANKK
jgi:hypothetical protein